VLQEYLPSSIFKCQIKQDKQKGSVMVEEVKYGKEDTKKYEQMKEKGVKA